MNKWLLKNKDQILISVIASVGAGIILKLIDILPKSAVENKNIVSENLNKIFNFPIKTYYIIIFAFLWFVISWIYGKVRIRFSRLKILEAKYGKNQNYIDISRELSDLIEDNKLKVVIGNSIAGDPLVGVNKEAVVTYKIDKKSGSVIVPEYEVLKLP